MKSISLFLFVFLPSYVLSQINETFSDGNFSVNPEWVGVDSNFIVNEAFELQSVAKTTSVSYLATHSNVFVNAVWECSFRINYTTSSSNYACFYISADDKNVQNENLNGLYVQVGGTNDEVSLYVQKAGKKTKIIDGVDKRTDGKPVEISVRVTRSGNGTFDLYSKLTSEAEYFHEGTVVNNLIASSDYVALLYSNTSTTGNSYFFDNINVSGDVPDDYDAPKILSVSLLEPNRVVIVFSEQVRLDDARFEVDNSIGPPDRYELSENNKQLILTFPVDFEKGIVYSLSVRNVSDLIGNFLIEAKNTIAVTEMPDQGDLLINEIMFNAPENAPEYVEIINVTGKVLNISGLRITTRKVNSDFNTGSPIPEGCFVAPNGFVALTSYPDMLAEYFACPETAAFVEMLSWSSLNNESSDLVLLNQNSEVLDEVTYSENWHHAMIKNPKGVALERVHPFLASAEKTTWHSAASEVNYGTPGYKNSQYREINVVDTLASQKIWLEPEAFSPDNDGFQDQCFIHYEMPQEGYIAKCMILQPSGTVVKTLFVDNLLAEKGMYFWDGAGNDGNLVASGIYVLYFEAFHVGSGDKKTYKKPVVVSFR